MTATVVMNRKRIHAPAPAYDDNNDKKNDGAVTAIRRYPRILLVMAMVALSHLLHIPLLWLMGMAWVAKVLYDVAKGEADIHARSAEGHPMHYYHHPPPDARRTTTTRNVSTHTEIEEEDDDVRAGVLVVGS